MGLALIDDVQVQAVGRAAPGYRIERNVNQKKLRSSPSPPVLDSFVVNYQIY